MVKTAIEIQHIINYHGLALSILRSKRTHSMLGFLANASAAQAPDGPPPRTATLNFVPTMATGSKQK